MTVSEIEKNGFERYLANRSASAGGLDGHECAASFTAQLVQRASDVDYLRRYAESCPGSGVQPEDYAAKLVRLDSTCTVLAAIHFLRRSTDFPFVDVSAQSTSLPRPLPLTVLTKAFACFSPRAIRIWRSSADPLPEHAKDDLVIVGGALGALQHAPDLPGLERIRLEADSGVAWYDEYRQMYDVASDVPASRLRGPTLESRASLAECARAGALFRVVIDGMTAGVIAARPDSYRYWRGWHIVEEVLHPRIRGHHLAPAMQQALLRSLNADREGFVFGTIEAGNTPSLKTALRVGRRILEIGTFVAVDAHTLPCQHEA